MYISPNHPDYERLAHGRSTAEARAPEMSGELLAAFPRQGPGGVEQELRVVLDSFNVHLYVAVRLWQRDRDAGAWWPLKGKGVSIRIGECEGVADALRRALGRGDARRLSISSGEWSRAQRPRRSS
jgi:hypothetical protein